MKAFEKIRCVLLELDFEINICNMGKDKIVVLKAGVKVVSS